MAIAYVNSTYGQNTGTPATDIPTSTLSTTTGNLIVVPITFGGTTVNSVSDTALNTYYQCTGAFVAAGGSANDIWYAPGITGNAANIVTVHFAAGTTYAT